MSTPKPLNKLIARAQPTHSRSWEHHTPASLGNPYPIHTKSQPLPAQLRLKPDSVSRDSTICPSSTPLPLLAFLSVSVLPSSAASQDFTSLAATYAHRHRTIYTHPAGATCHRRTSRSQSFEFAALITHVSEPIAIQNPCITHERRLPNSWSQRLRVLDLCVQTNRCTIRSSGCYVSILRTAGYSHLGLKMHMF